MDPLVIAEMKEGPEGVGCLREFCRCRTLAERYARCDIPWTSARQSPPPWPKMVATVTAPSNHDKTGPRCSCQTEEMTLFRYPWLSARRRRELFGHSERMPHGLDAAAASIDTLRAAFRSPECRTLRGRWNPGASTEWHLWGPDPFVQVHYRSVDISWLNHELSIKAMRLPPVAVPLPPLQVVAPFSSGAWGLNPEAEEPSAIRTLSSHVQRSLWRAVPEAQVQEWLDATEVYLERWHSILADLRDRSAKATMLDPRNPLHARRIVEEAVPRQRAALSRLLEAGKAYEPTLRSVRIGLPKIERHDPRIDPVHMLRAWADEKIWVVALEGEAGRIMHVKLIGEDEGRTWIDGELAYEVGGAVYWALSLNTIKRAASTVHSGQTALKVEWDQASLAFADRAVAGFWNDVRAEHDLPGDFAAAWLALSGSAHLPGTLYGVARDFRVPPKLVRDREAELRHRNHPPAGFEWSGGG